MRLRGGESENLEGSTGTRSAGPVRHQQGNTGTGLDTRGTAKLGEQENWNRNEDEPEMLMHEVAPVQMPSLRCLLTADAPDQGARTRRAAR